jgi:penicillin V acylase-like amidase (Ntn superfamily)
MKKFSMGLFFLMGITAGALVCSLWAEAPGNCSTFMLKADAAVLVGHNLDESPGLHVPGLVCINKRGEYREGITWYELIADPGEFEKSLIPYDKKPEPKIHWISRYGSITFNSEGLDFPDGGMNEKGLSLFEMSMGDTRHKEDEGNPTLFICLWIQYQLDNCATVEEVIANAHGINLQGWSWHYFVADKSGDWAIIEFLDREVVVHKGQEAPFPVLCNTEYSKELERIGNYQDFGGGTEIKKAYPRAPRFVRAAKMIRDFNTEVHTSPEEYALQILDEIKIRRWNKWALLADAANMMVYFHTDRNRKLRYVYFRDFDFSEGGPSLLLDIHADVFGNVASDFVEYAFDKNLEHTQERARHLFKKRFKGLIDNGVTADVYARRFADYSERMRQK